MIKITKELIELLTMITKIENNNFLWKEAFEELEKQNTLIQKNDFEDTIGVNLYRFYYWYFENTHPKIYSLKEVVGKILWAPNENFDIERSLLKHDKLKEVIENLAKFQFEIDEDMEVVCDPNEDDDFDNWFEFMLVENCEEENIKLPKNKIEFNKLFNKSKNIYINMYKKIMKKEQD